MSPKLPTGTVTFMLTDVEGSTRLWEQHPVAMKAALARHDGLLETTIASAGGVLIKQKGEGDSTFAVFARASDALAAAVAAQRAFRSEAWPDDLTVRVRIALHTGEAELRDGDYYGTAVNRAARLREMGHGGQVLCSQATAELIGGSDSGIELLDLGEHRLRDLARPERVLQAAHPALPRDFPPLRSLEAVPNNLPVQLTSFIGRQDEISELRGLLREHRLLTLTGAAGSGKTRLSLQLGAQVLPSYPAGVWLVELGGLSDAGAVVEAAASALGLARQPGEALDETFISWLRNKQLLLLLDNCEHLLGAVSVLVDAVLPAAPGVRIVATSREPLAIRGERVVGVPSLPTPPEGSDVAALVGIEAVELFVERARAARSGFALTAENGPAVAQLCRRLDGIPLAIELAAARVRSMAPAEIAARLDQRFRLLTGGARGATSRHQTLRSAIDWSYDALDDVERELLGRLSVCAGGFDLAAAEAVGSGGAIDAFDVDDLLSRLVDKSLITAEDRGGSTRYRMLETIRAYALERLEDAGQVDAARRDHASHYVAFAAEAAAGLKGLHERTWLARVEDELDNLRAAVTWSLEVDEPSCSLAIVASLALTGLRIEPVVGGWSSGIVANANARSDCRYPVAMAFHAWTTLRDGRGDDADQLAKVALGLLEVVDDDEIACLVIESTAAIEAYLGRSPLEQARRWLEHARRISDRYFESLALNMLAVGHMFSGESAREPAEQSLAMARRSGSPSAIAYCAFTTALSIGPTDLTRAMALIEESVANATAVANDFALVTAESSRSSLFSRAGDHGGAARAFLDSARRAFRHGHRGQQAHALWAVAASLAAMHRPEPAAVLVGWFAPVFAHARDAAYDPANAGGLTNLNLHPNAAAALADVARALGADRDASLRAVGAAMGDEEILAYAEDQVGGEVPEASGGPDISVGDNRFCRDGDVWQLAYEGESCQLRDAKGLHYLSVLLARPGIEVHVVDLVGGGVLGGGTGDAIDAQAAAAYRARVTELEAEEAEATEWSDPERAARAREELDAITDELVSAYGSGGRPRQGPDPVERARKAVANRIHDSLKRIEALHPSLGRHLRNAIRTGTFCSYQPERPTVWK